MSFLINSVTSSLFIGIYGIFIYLMKSSSVSCSISRNSVLPGGIGMYDREVSG
jgi:hypothetical protein